jgi:hypothetical protein
MNNLDNLITENGKIDALLYATENALIEATEETGTSKKVERLYNLFYMLVDEHKAFTAALDSVQGDAKVCNVIFAVSHCKGGNRD